MHDESQLNLVFAFKSLVFSSSLVRATSAVSPIWVFPVTIEGCVKAIRTIRPVLSMLEVLDWSWKMLSILLQRLPSGIQKSIQLSFCLKQTLS